MLTSKSRTFWVALFLIRAAGLLIGLDRLPMVPTVNPEVIINDPAVSLSRGDGFVAFSFEHSVNGLDRLYAHFPPIFIALQALIFRLFGFSAFTLRALSVFCDLATCAVFLLVIRELYVRGILDRLGATLAGTLIVLEPTAMIHAREARMESLNTLLGGIAFFFCIRAGRDIGPWLAAGAMIGLALATHPAALLMWVAFEAWTLVSFRQLGLIRWISVNAVPPIVMIATWLIAYGSNVVAAVGQMRRLALFAGIATLRMGELFAQLIHRSPGGFQNAGGLGFIFTLATLGWALWRGFSGPPGPAAWRTILVGLIAVLVVQLALLQFVIPTSGMNRVVMIYPFALLCAGVAVSHLGQSAAKRAVVIGAFAALLEVALIAGYLLQLRQNWNERSADRFDPIVSAVPQGARVAGPPELWFGFLQRDRQFAVIYRAMGEDEFWNSDNAFDSYDVIILDPNWPQFKPWHEKAALGRPVERIVHSYARDFLVVAKRLN
jgi:4-amino-4-deoxy-L-arabinose transferase-like glycosyltransferase